MRTEDLIDRLSGDLSAVRTTRLPAIHIAVAAGLAITVTWAWLGLRPDLGQAVLGPTFWLKALYALALAGAGLWLAARLGRPAADRRAPAVAVALVLVAAAMAALIEQAALPAAARMDALMGQTWRYCPPNILKIAALAAPVVFLGARRFAPTRPALMGAALGLGVGAIAAAAYGLHCPEATATFVAVWYTLGMVAAGLVGAVIGRFALRW